MSRPWSQANLYNASPAWACLAGFVALAFLCPPVAGSDIKAAAQFRKDIQPLLVEYCYDCHGEGMSKGKVAFDEFKSDEELVSNRELWSKALNIVRAGIMPPEKKPRPSTEEMRRLENWIKYEALGIDPKDPDPGRVTIRRLNRSEYRNTIRDLMGYDFKVEEELPPDDTGYGFDNIGDVLTLSPLLLEKYMQAAETITAAAVPRVPHMIREKTILGSTGRREGGKRDAERYSFYEEAKISQTFKTEQQGSFRLILDLEVLGQFAPDPGRCRVTFRVDDRQLLEKEFGWFNSKKFRFEFDEKLPTGEHRLAIELQPLTPSEQKKNSLDLRVVLVQMQGPQEKEHWARPKNFELFFWKDPPETKAERREYAREVLGRFARKAYRRPVDDKTVQRLVAIAEGIYTQPGKRFEDGIAQAMVPVLASPRFLFRVEENDPAEARKSHPLVDEYSLAARLSYFLWSTTPDEQLMRLAEQGQLRTNLAAQVKRMLADVRSQELIENFVGQWLQTRDVEGIDINARAVLARDNGQDRDLQRRRRRFQELRDIPDEKLTPEERVELEQMREQFRRRFANRPQVELDGPLRRALRQETEMAVAYVMREDRSVLELIQSDYTFLNERLAKHYGITNVTGNEMRRVTLPDGSPRGGVLTHGSVLIVTSNPTRTSPVKRGLFILDNILGTPPPPAPGNVPPLEESDKETEGRQPTLREVLSIHREKPLCNSCHNRMDPLGLALENFNALGMWRDRERGQTVDATGKLITGEPFEGVRDIKRILTSTRRSDFYRCLSEKLLTYALGRGLEDYDVHTLDQIVGRLEREQGRFSAVLMGVIESAPFQKRRNSSMMAAAEATRSAETVAQSK